MSGDLHLDVDGVNRVYNQLRRASDAAAEAHAYVEKHCDMSTLEQGLLLWVLDVHPKAYGEMTAALTRLQELTQGAATQVNRAQVAYTSVDHEAAAALDDSYPGARNLSNLWAALTLQPPDPQDARVPFVDREDATRGLTNPQYAVPIEMWSINPLADLISPMAWLRQAAISVFGHDPFEGWSRQFSGDWRGWVHAGVAMSRAGGAAGAIANNIVTGTIELPAAWRGNAAEAFQEYGLSLASAARSVEEAGRQYHDLYMQAAEAVKKFYDVVAGLTTDLLDALLIISSGLTAGTATIATGVGPAIGYGIATYYTIQAIDLYNEISKVYGAAEDVLKAIAGSIAAVDAATGIKNIADLQPYTYPGN